MNTNVINVGTRWNFWKKAEAGTSMHAKNVELRICRNYFQVFLLDKASSGEIPAQPERVPPERADSDRKDSL